MNATLRGQLQDFQIRAWHDMRTGEAALPCHDLPSTLRLLSGLAHDSPLARDALREVAATSLHARCLYRYSDQDILEHLAGQLVAGWLRLVALERPPAGAAFAGGTDLALVLEQVRDDRPTLPQRPARQPASIASWIAFQVIDDATGAPVAGVDLHLKGLGAASGSYTTDGEGLVHLIGLPAGTCDLEHVLDSEAFEIVRFE